MSEAFTTADMLGVVMLGMGIVFAVLIIIYIMMTLMRVIFYHPVKAQASATQEIQPVENRILENEDEEAAAVVAVIAACLDRSPSSFRLVNLYRK